MAKSLSRCRNQTNTSWNRSEKSAVLAASPPLGGGDEPERQNCGTGRHTNQRKLTEEQATTIRYLVGSGKLSMRAAAAQYGVSPKSIAGIMANRLYVAPIIEPPPAPIDGRSYGLALVRRARAQKRRRRKPEPVTVTSSARDLYAAEKKLADERRQRTILAEAKREYEALLAREEAARKGGRPPKPGGGKNIHVGKSRRGDFTKGDPANALIEALGYYGAA